MVPLPTCCPPSEQHHMPAQVCTLEPSRAPCRELGQEAKGKTPLCLLKVCPFSGLRTTQFGGIAGMSEPGRLWAPSPAAH